MKRGIPVGWVNFWLVLYAIPRPRYWSQAPWRFVSLLNWRMGEKMRDKWRTKQ